MEIRIAKTELFRNQVRTRMPFKYGIATLTESPQVFVRINARIDGRDCDGISSDLIPPKWFTKDVQRPIEEEITELFEVIQNACCLAERITTDSVFEFWEKLYGQQYEWGNSLNYPPLLSNFGTTLIERALIDAYCRSCKETFHGALYKNSLGIKLSRIHADLSGDPGAYLADEPLEEIFCRHTVGLSDPLWPEEVVDRPNDPLPCALSEAMETYGIRHLKIKINGNIGNDLQRLKNIAGLVSDLKVTSFAFTLDGNEQYKSVADLRELWRQLQDDPQTKEFCKKLIFIEQPFHRKIALSAEVGKELQNWKDRPLIIIDESDGELKSFPLALQLGYDGTSHKNCKGIFKGIANRCLTVHLQRGNRNRPVMMSGEDLGNIGPVSLLQDIAAMAALGIESVERNGHHYFSGLSMFSKPLQDMVTESHPDLYERSRTAWPSLKVVVGKISARSVNEAPFGLKFMPSMDGFSKIR